MLLITAIFRAFSFVDFEPALDSVNALYEWWGPEFRAPSYYIRGTVTQLDENVLAEVVNGIIRYILGLKK